ncbi:organic cation transporter protein [Exaiptasia diaphana]|uniref:Major facilitator superfamily (MFS) profile domain-containing protein n=1 Tax=Exaiptasia diaphana TaxID=2652724 RepID=A0A913Y1P7_EXADI|nr:organic cation transporter protein [Exaiptasia diaphana]
MMADKEGQAATDEVREYDDIFKYVQSFGRYQKIVLFASCFLVMLCSSQFAALLFVYGTPNFHCEDTNSTCPPNKCCNNCTSYVFDGPFRSVVSEFNLICDKAYIGATVQACFYGGMLAGATSSGILADYIGRRRTIFITVFIVILSSVCSVFADCVSLLGVLRFMIGIGSGGIQASHFTLGLELLGPKHRSLYSVIYQIYFTAGYFVFNFFAYFVRDWRLLILMNSLPGIILYLFMRIFPESPRWLLSKNRLKEAEDVLVKCGSDSLDRNQLKKAIKDISIAQINEEKKRQERIYTPLDLVRTPKLRRRSIFLAINWFSVSFVGNAFFLYIGNLAGSIYLNFFLVNIACPIGAIATGFLLKRIGHRLTHAVVLCMVGILCLSSLAVPDDQPLARTWIFVSAFGISNGMWVTIFLIGTELFPTVLRKGRRPGEQEKDEVQVESDKYTVANSQVTSM